MLDTLSTQLLEKINDVCFDGNYKVLEKSDLINSMSKHNIDVNSLENILKHLQARDFVNIKYSDEEVYCLALMPKGRLFDEKVKQAKSEQKKTKKMLTYVVLASLGSSFVGAFLAMLVFKLVFWG